MSELSGKIVGAFIVLGLIFICLLVTIAPKFEAKSGVVGSAIEQPMFKADGHADTSTRVNP